MVCEGKEVAALNLVRLVRCAIADFNSFACPSPHPQAHLNTT